MLHGLEGAERPAELFARLDVCDGPLQGARRRPHRLRREQGGGPVSDRVESAGHVRGVVRAEQFGLGVAEFHTGQRAGLVRRGPAGADDSGRRVRADQEEERTAAREAAGVGRDQEEPRAVPVEDLVRLPVQPPARPAADRPRLDAARPAATRPGAAGRVAGEAERGAERAAGYGRRRGQFPGGDARQQGGALGPGAECGDQGRGERGGGDQG